ncbi:hypothetical protein PPUJ20066_04660 [Pseudomonas putida]|nr:hypothetical protein PPUJ20066_04660 [Pseudomonas putida]
MPGAFYPKQFGATKRGAAPVFGKACRQPGLSERSDLLKPLKGPGQGALRAQQARLATVHGLAKIGGGVGKPGLRVIGR